MVGLQEKPEREDIIDEDIGGVVKKVNCVKTEGGNKARHRKNER